MAEIKAAGESATSQRNQNLDDDFEKRNTNNIPLLIKEISIKEPEDKNSAVQRAIRRTFQSIAHLSNLLPTGTVLAFQLLSPIFTNLGQCHRASRFMTSGLVALFSATAFLVNFTDSFRDRNGNVCYGFATTSGLCVIDGSAKLPEEEARKYRLQYIDFVHAFMSFFVFLAIAMFDENVVRCFYPGPSDEAREVLTALPVGIGVICSLLFVVFPTKRHGIGFPLSEK